RCKRIFKKKQLVKGVTWKFKRRPARVRLKVLFRTRQGDRPYSKKLWREHFSAESLSGVFIRLPLGPSDGSAIYGVSFNEEIDRGELVRSQSEFVYRDLEPGTTYCITHCLLVDQVRFPLLKGTGKKVVAEKLAENPTTTVVIKTEPASYYDLTVRPVDKRDGSVLDRAAVFVSGHVRGPFGIGVVDVKLIEGLYEIEVKCADYATARKRVRLDKDQEITVELERLTEPVYWLYAESERLPRSDFNKRIAFDVYSKSDQGPVGGGFSEKARQKIARVPSGDYLVIAKGFRKGVEDKEPDNAVFAAREVKIKNADAVAEIDFDKENWTLFEVQFPKGGEVKQRLGAQLWGMWKGKTLRLGSGLLSKKNTARFSIPFDGNYWLEVLVPSKKHYEEEAKRYRKGKAYYTQRVSVKRGKTVTAKVVPSTSHKPTGEAPELADLPGSADVMEQDHIENDEPPGGSELQPSGSESSTNQWVLPAGIALGVLVIVGITVRAMKRKKRWGDQTQDGAT
ncbi:MAG: hypothetical protein KGZ25_12400, partial [Planctomycetes bacterium]|nr:hypothetical protein [Planctomycetota bacterium]